MTTFEGYFCWARQVISPLERCGGGEPRARESEENGP
jgi:hypothetical protein